MSKCATKFCRGSVTKNGHSPFCSCCRSRRFREKFPLKESFRKLKLRAGERGHAFTLTFAEYEVFTLKTGYAELKGKTKYSLSIDRIDSTKGYHADNIRALTLSLNSRLAHAKMPQWLKDEMILAEQGKLQHQMDEFGNYVL